MGEQLSARMPLHDLNDPKALARDATNLGRWGNGDVEIGLVAYNSTYDILGC